MKKTVYVACPYSLGDIILNVRKAIEVADILLDNGFVPFVPHLTMLWHLVSPKPYAEWMEYDLEWLKKCDMVLRVDGKSRGADGEVAVAKDLTIKVYYSIIELLDGERP